MLNQFHDEVLLKLQSIHSEVSHQECLRHLTRKSQMFYKKNGKFLLLFNGCLNNIFSKKKSNWVDLNFSRKMCFNI